MPCDDAGLSAIAARSDVCTCTDDECCTGASEVSAELGWLATRCQGQKRWRGEVLSDVLGHRQAQSMVLARQRLAFASAFHLRLGDVSLDFDVIEAIGGVLMEAVGRPVWLGKEAVVFAGGVLGVGGGGGR